MKKKKTTKTQLQPRIWKAEPKLKRKADAKVINMEGLKKRKDWDSLKLLFVLI